MPNEDIDFRRVWFVAKIAALWSVLGFGGMFLVGSLPLPKLWRLIIGPELPFVTLGLIVGLCWDHPKMPEEARGLARVLFPLSLGWLLLFNLIRFAVVLEWRKVGIAALVVSAGAASMYLPFLLGRAIARRRHAVPDP